MASERNVSWARGVMGVVAATLIVSGLAWLPVAQGAEAKSEKVGQIEISETAIENLSVEVNFDFVTRCVFRGAVLTDEEALQPSVTVGWSDVPVVGGDLSLTVWGNWETSDVNSEQGNFTRIHYAIAYRRDICSTLAWKLGWIYYEIPPDEGLSTNEGYLGIEWSHACSTPWMELPLNGGFTLYQDFDAAHGTYLQFDLGCSWENVCAPCEGVVVDTEVGGWIGYGSKNHNNFYYEDWQKEGWNNLGLRFAVPVRIGEHLTVTPAIEATMALDGGQRKAIHDDEDNIIGKLCFTWTF